jgi:hypothetical protein
MCGGANCDDNEWKRKCKKSCGLCAVEEQVEKQFEQLQNRASNSLAQRISQAGRQQAVSRSMRSQAKENADMCVDKNGQCAAWARGGECSANQEYMLSNCAKSCAPACGGGSGSSNSFSLAFYVSFIGIAFFGVLGFQNYQEASNRAGGSSTGDQYSTIPGGL